MRVVLVVLLAACAPRAMSVPTNHPANPDAPIGRTAGAPAALRPGVATLEDPAPTPPKVDHSQHTSPDPAKEMPNDTSDPAKDRDKVDSVQDMPGEPKRVDPEKVNPQKVENDKAKPDAKKPAPKKPAPKKPTAKPAEPAKEPAKPPAPPPMDHSGHGGH